MPAQHYVIGKGDVIADLAIMTDVGSGHQQAAIAHFGYATAVLSPGVDGDAFANFAIGTYRQPRGSAAILDRLRRGA